MKASFISTSAISEATRLSIARSQQALAEAQKELSSGRKADVGLSLGSATGQTISLRNDLDRLNSIVASNGSARGRLEVT
ncbi:MAG: flagellar hook-associated family protein, partial [Hyphomicrobiaceae bacterium]